MITTLRIEAPHFVAAVDLHTGRAGGAIVILTAPILKYMVGWTQYRVESYCQQHGWKCELLPDAVTPPVDKNPPME